MPRRINCIDLEAVRVSHHDYLTGLLGDLLGDLQGLSGVVQIKHDQDSPVYMP